MTVPGLTFYSQNAQQEKGKELESDREEGEREESRRAGGVGGVGAAKPVQQLIPIAYQQLANFALTDTLAHTGRETHTHIRAGRHTHTLPRSFIPYDNQQ